MPTDTARSRTRAVDFTLRAVAWSLGLFGLLRLNWVETHGLLPLTRLQGRLAVGLCGMPALPIDATLACSGADALALCVGAILAYPAGWRMRLAGAGGGLALVLGLNTMRIGTLGRVAASPAWFETLHLYVWPAALTLAIAGYVFGWMRVVDGRQGAGSQLLEPVARDATPATVSSAARLTPRFIGLTAAFLVLFTAASPLYLESAGVLSVAAFIARAAAAALHVIGVEARASANVLWTARGGFVVTQECVSTPLIPIYLAAVFAYAGTWRTRALGLVAAAPLFVGLGIARLLVVALPAALVASPLYLIHAFYQLLLAAVVVCARRHLASRRRRHGPAPGDPGPGARCRGRPTARRAVRARPDARDGDDRRRRACRRRGGHAARGSAGRHRAPPRLPGGPLPGALGRGLRRRRLEALPGRPGAPRGDPGGDPGWPCTSSPRTPGSRLRCGTCARGRWSARSSSPWRS